MLTILCIYAFGMDVIIQIISLYGITGTVFFVVQTESLYKMRIRLILNRLRTVYHQSESESDRVVINILLFCIDDKERGIQ